MGVNPTGGNRRQIAENLFNKLDAKDGSTDQKINASVWNSFVSANGTGRTIRNFIEKDNAMRSIMTYLTRKSDAETSIDQLGEEWANMDRVDSKTDDNGVFKKDENPPAAQKEAARTDLGTLADKTRDVHKSALTGMYSALFPNEDISKMTPNDIANKKFEQYKGQEKVELPTGSGKFFTFDEEGYIAKITDKNGNTLLDTDIDDNENRYIDSEYEYNSNGHKTRTINYNEDGTVRSNWGYAGTGEPNHYTVDYDNDSTTEFVYDSDEASNVNYTKVIYRDNDGNVTETIEYEYDAEGNKTKEITRDEDGNVTSYEEYEYDAEGNRTRTITRDKDGNVTDVYDHKKNKYIIQDGERV